MYVGFTWLHCTSKPSANSAGRISCCDGPPRSSPVSLGIAAPTALTCGPGAERMLPGISVINDERPVASLAFTGLFHLARRRLAALRSGNNQENRRRPGRRKKSFRGEQPKKIQSEEDRISNRQFSGTFIPPLRSSWTIISVGVFCVLGSVILLMASQKRCTRFLDGRVPM